MASLTTSTTKVSTAPGIPAFFSSSSSSSSSSFVANASISRESLNTHTNDGEVRGQRFNSPKSFRWDVPSIKLKAGIRVQLYGLQGDSAVFNGKAATITRADEKLTDVVNVSVDPERRKNGQVNGGEIREEISVRQGLNDVQVLTDNIKLILSDGSLASEWSGMFAGDGCAYKRVSIRQGSSFHYGVAAARISCDFDNANKL